MVLDSWIHLNSSKPTGTKELLKGFRRSETGSSALGSSSATVRNSDNLANTQVVNSGNATQPFINASSLGPATQNESADIVLVSSYDNGTESLSRTAFTPSTHTYSAGTHDRGPIQGRPGIQGQRKPRFQRY